MPAFARRRTQQAQDNRRAAPRTELRVEVLLETDVNFYYGMTHNLAEGGLFVCTYELFPIGAELTVHLTLPPDTTPLSLRGRVQWVREYSERNHELPPGIGLQLLDPPPAALRDLLAQREPTLYE